MKNKNAFTLIELMTVICIIAIIAALLMPILSGVKTHHSNNTSTYISHTEDNSPYSDNNVVNKSNQIKVGDLVYIDGLSITGKVNAIDAVSPFADLLTKDTNGTISVLHHINTATLTKIE